ncbi:ABC transporter ATP-binding protein [Tumebacillus algifaecis]|uniref:ABC transporter ATP-binding protein n=1 Tax=Tumebacillus algifaecis TaxID=1214604 RepID=A0A223CZH3_9BACL|nr:ABC transporter ATP-binding protein [Tumebacillus algifaecis]ASS74655.1 ABC transporter ATP-binding protein [Tumebacillus algifaecis]
MLKLEGVRKVFNEGSPDQKVALDHLDLTLQPGDFVTIIGSNGAGKSTLMNMISGVLRPDAGTIEIDGQSATHLPEHRRAQVIGRVFQDPMAGTAPSMTIEENLAIAYSRKERRTLRIGVSRKRKELFRELLADLNLGLEQRLSAKAGLLSGGERQALSLLMASFTDPKVLLLDEHTAALDPARAQVVTDLTREIVERKRLTTLMVTHNMQQALDLGNRLLMMDQGRIILDVPSADKLKLTVPDLLAEFERIRGEKLVSDRVVLG